MRGHWISQTRKLNRHYQSAGASGPVERLLIWELTESDAADLSLTTPGIGYPMMVDGIQAKGWSYRAVDAYPDEDYDYAPGTIGYGLKRVCVYPRRYRLYWELYTDSDGISPGLAYAATSSYDYGIGYDTDGTPGSGVGIGPRFYAQGIDFVHRFDEVTYPPTDILAHAQSGWMMKPFWSSTVLMDTYLHYKPDTTELHEVIGGATYYDTLAYGRMWYYYTVEDYVSEEEIAVDQLSLPASCGSMYMDYTHLTAPMDGADRTFVTYESTRVYQPIFQIYFGGFRSTSSTADITGRMWGRIWLETA